jgi:GNAT superfamily N-acetyltransferase
MSPDDRSFEFAPGRVTMDVEQIEIRPARIEDASDISSLSGQLGYQSSGADIKKRLENISYSNEHCVFVAYLASGKIIGWIHVFSTLRIESDSCCEIGGIVVEKSSRKRGVGAKLIDAAQKWTTENGFSKLRVRSRKERENAKQFYLNLGFLLQKEQNIFDKDIVSKK